ncbi:hypothetical protein HYT23_04625 [Candidatus Pacearchaeota archaeon]|nr:hypothetical protein [Candidatus Pacearchaeota archaeon]
MRLIYFTKEEEEKAKQILKERDKLYKILVSAEHGKYKKGEYVKSTGGERLLITDIKIMKDFEAFKKEYIHYPELKTANLEEIQQAFTHKKVEIIELKKYRR